MNYGLVMNRYNSSYHYRSCSLDFDSPIWGVIFGVSKRKNTRLWLWLGLWASLGWAEVIQKHDMLFIYMFVFCIQVR